MASDAYDLGWVTGFAKSLEKRVGELEALAVRDRDRRDAIEARVAKIENRELNAKLASPTDSGRIVVDANEFERLRRIEKAAREYVLEFEAFKLNSDQTRLKIFNRKFEELREALKR